MKKYNLDKYNVFDKEIFELALLGISYPKIARFLNIPENTVYRAINSLSDKKNANYNIILHSSIMTEQALANKKIVDYDLLEDIVNYINKGYSYLEIAVKLGLNSEEEVKKILKNLNENSESRREYVNINNTYKSKIENSLFAVYKRLDKLVEDGVDLSTYNSSLYKNYKKYKIRKDLLYTFINYDTTFTELASIYNINSKILYEYLTNKDGFAEKVLSKNNVKIFYDKAKKALEEKKQLDCKKAPVFGRYNKVNNKSLEESFARIYANLDYYIKMILTFKLSFEEFACFAKVEPSKELYDWFLKKANYEYKAVKYNFDDNNRSIDDFSHYELAKQFDRNFSLACFMKDYKKQKEYMKLLDDYEFKKIISLGKSTAQLSQEEKNVIFEYRLKYALSYNNLFKISGYNIDGWKVPLEYFEENNKLNKYNEELSRIPSVLKKTLLRKENSNE